MSGAVLAATVTRVTDTAGLVHAVLESDPTSVKMLQPILQSFFSVIQR